MNQKQFENYMRAVINEKYVGDLLLQKTYIVDRDSSGAVEVSTSTSNSK